MKPEQEDSGGGEDQPGRPSWRYSLAAKLCSKVSRLASWLLYHMGWSTGMLGAMLLEDKAFAEAHLADKRARVGLDDTVAAHVRESLSKGIAFTALHKVREACSDMRAAADNFDTSGTDTRRQQHDDECHSYCCGTPCTSECEHF